MSLKNLLLWRQILFGKEKGVQSQKELEPHSNGFSTDVFSVLLALELNLTNCFVRPIKSFLKSFTDCCNSENAPARSSKLEESLGDFGQ